MVVLAVAALAVGITLARNATRTAAERAELPPPSDCLRFPGACEEGVPQSPPPELAELHAQVASADSAWRATLERESRSGVFPEKGLADMRDALVATESAVRDARAFVHETRSSSDAELRTFALGVMRTAYENKLALLTRARLLIEGAI